MESVLKPGQVLKIPLNKSNFSQTDSKAAADEIVMPVYHKVKEKEGLYRIGLNYNKVPAATLKKWNKLSSDQLNVGANLIVGYIKLKKNQSALLQKAVEKSPDPKIIITPPENQPIIVEQPGVKNEEKEKKTLPVELKKEESVKPVETPVRPVVYQGTDFNGGVFKSLYESQTSGNEIEKQDGKGGVFKSTSGWKDGKYYCLHNSAPAGSVIKITNTATGKSIYAKVLDVMPDIKQNAGLLIRLSSAAADELQVGENNFNCTLNYSK